MPSVKTEDERPPKNLCPATTEYMAQLGKIGARQLRTALRLKEHYRGSDPLSQEELETIIKESTDMDREIRSLWETFEAHRVEHGCRDMYVYVPDEEDSK
jgi:hypothetical protein